MDEGRPLVTVIMPAFNARDTIEEAIGSALAQTHRPIEIVVVDDGSEDGTAQLVRARFGNQVHLVSESHSGRGAARNRGLKLARGTFLQFLDADDVLVPAKVERQVAFLTEHPEFAVAYGPVECFAAEDPSRRWSFRPEVHPTGQVLGDMVDDGFVLPVAALVRTDWCRRVGGFDPTLPSNEDWDLWLRLAAAGGRFAYHPVGEVVGLYRVRTRLPRTREGDVHLLSGVLTLQKLERSLGPEVARRLGVRRAIGRWRFGHGRSLMETGDRLAGLREMVRALTEDRRSWDYKLTWIVAGALLGGPRAAALIQAVQDRRRRRSRKRPPCE
jgi:glycosyltransferase involved in cell wall biosynthesis